MNEKIREMLIKALHNLGLPVPDDINVEHPSKSEHGDYSTNIAILLANKFGRSPAEMASAIKEKIMSEPPDFLSAVQVAGSGFLNFFLSESFFYKEIEKILDQNYDYGNNNVFAKQKILIEHSSPNLGKPFHIGHLMNNVLGTSLAHLLQASGAQIIQISYPSDISLGIGKAIFVLMKWGGTFALADLSLDEQIQKLGDAYIQGIEIYDTDETSAKKIREITSNLYTKTKSDEYELFQYIRKINIEYFENIIHRLGSNIDEYIFESEAAIRGKEIVNEKLGEVFTESEGAIVYDGESRGLHTRVFQNSDGNPTYEAKDLGLLSLKTEKYSPDLSIILTDQEQKSYFQVILDAAGRIEELWQERTKHVCHGRLSFDDQKISSRSGNTILATEVLSTIASEVAQRSIKNLETENINTIALAAIKYTILKTSMPKNVQFNSMQALSFEGDSGPYLLYTIARIKSLLKSQNITDTAQPEIYPFIKILHKYPEIMLKSATRLAPHYLLEYLIKLASEFNTFYAQKKIIGGDNETWDCNCARATLYVLEKGLDNLGIKTVSEM